MLCIKYVFANISEIIHNCRGSPCGFSYIFFSIHCRKILGIFCILLIIYLAYFQKIKTQNQNGRVVAGLLATSLEKKKYMRKYFLDFYGMMNSYENCWRFWLNFCNKFHLLINGLYPSKVWFEKDGWFFRYSINLVHRASCLFYIARPMKS